LAQQRTLAALGLGTALTTTSTAAGASAVGTSMALKLVGIGAAVIATSAGVLAWRGTRTAMPHDVVAAPPTGSAAPGFRAPTEKPPASPATAVEAPAAPSADVPPERGVRTPGVDSTVASLAQEVAALERAHKLATHDPDAALRELDRYHARFPGGALAAEETVLRVEALLARGDDRTARVLADAFSTAHPESPYARRVQDLVRSKKK
jgi:hypothetical protein